ncbi:hypothetical protein CCR75_003121 [Bremia lactucae]|uniref:F-BAR domain-containing protein n=1 Tax=Bremia lactucae TaxID=4779 RepID=A0A976FHD1_BRELC|nr:hypothetical protein CCR75_003121 [Bremia lactucae]
MASSVPHAAEDLATKLPLDLAFATDLLFNLDDVRAACASGLRAHGNLMTMLKSRINLEKTYAQELSKMARCAHIDELENSSMKNAMVSVKSQYLNTSVQHQQLANNLEEDVLRPIENLYELNSQKAQTLSRRLNHAKKCVEFQEDIYRKDFSAFDKCFREASASFSAAMESGFSSALLETRYYQYILQMEALDSPDKTSLSSALASRARRSSGAAALRSINNHKLKSWLLSISDTNRKEDLANHSVKHMAAAENARRKCQQTWQGVEMSRIRMYRAVQAVLADYQHLAEARIDTIAISLRKHVVFASSALANEQYDWQALAQKLEDIDVQGDIVNFIQTTRGDIGRFPNLASLTVSDLCNNTNQPLMVSPSMRPCQPLRKSCLKIQDISTKKVPIDYDGNQKLLGETLSANFDTSSEVQTLYKEDVCSRSGSDFYSLGDSSCTDAEALMVHATNDDEKRVSMEQDKQELDNDDLENKSEAI